MVFGAKKLWINPVLRSRPPTMLGRSLFCLNQVECREPLPHALTRRGAESISLEAVFFAFACIKRFVGMPEPTVLIGMPIGEMVEHHKKVALGVRERFPQPIVIKRRVWREKKVRVSIPRFRVRLIHIVH